MNDSASCISGLSPEMRARVHDALKRTGNAPHAGIGHGNNTGPFPLSLAQERLWFLDQWEPGSSLYNVAAAFRLPGPLSVPLLQSCINEIVRRHESLRTTFDSIAGEPVQKIAPRLEVPLTIVELETFRELEREAEAQRLVAV